MRLCLIVAGFIPYPLFFILKEQRALVSLIFPNGFNCLSLALVLNQIKKKKRLGRSWSDWLMLVAVASLVWANFWSVVPLRRGSSALLMGRLGTPLYVLFYASILILLMRYVQWREFWKYRFMSIILAVFFALVFAVQAVTLSGPMHSMSWSPVILAYLPIKSAAMVAVMAGSALIMTVPEHLFLQSTLAMALAGFARAYDEFNAQAPSTSWAQAVWLTGCACITFSLVDARRCGRSLFESAQFSSWLSVRALLGCAVFGSTTTVFVAAMAFDILSIRSPHDVMVLSLSLFLGWSLANMLSLQFSTACRRSRALMPDPGATPELTEAMDITLPTIDRITRLDEVNELIQGYNTVVEQTNQLLTDRVKVSHNAALVRMATQVAHDIRSPLAALGMVGSDLGRLPEETRTLMRSALHRIQDIASELLYQQRAANKGAQETGDAKVPVLLSSLCEIIVSEKRVQHRARLGVSIEYQSDTQSYGIFAEVVPSQLKRVLSNVINNSVEAIDDAGSITIRITAEEMLVHIRIIDDGRGIPADVLRRLGQPDVTHGKEEGNGIGVRQARLSIEAWGGVLRFESQLGQGTTATITLPLRSAPPWFLRELDVTRIDTFVVLDDDASIHSIWTERLTRALCPQVQLVHLSSPADLRTYCAGSDDNSAKTFLMDYELLGHDVSGLDLIEELNLAPYAILVTSHFEELDIIARCLRLQVKLLPKPVAANVPFCGVEAIQSDGTIDAVLIDDDILVHHHWQAEAQRAGKSLSIYGKPAHFLAHSDHLPLDTPIYVDSELGGGIKGEEIAKQIFERGFEFVYLATGYERTYFSPMPWLAGILGKDPPF